MQRLKASGLVLMAVFSISALASTSAWAVELPEFTVETNAKGVDGAYQFNLAGGTYKCTNSTYAYTVVNHQLGTFVLDLFGCKREGTACNSLDDPAETILWPGDYHTVQLGTARLIRWKYNEIHVECGAGTLVLQRGTLLSTISPVNKKTTKFTDGIKTKEGKQECTAYEDDACEKIGVELLGSVNAKSFEQATVEHSENTMTTEKETEIVK